MARIVHDEGLLETGRPHSTGAAMAGIPSGGAMAERGGARLYRRSVRHHDGLLYFIGSLDGTKRLFIVSRKTFDTVFEGRGTRLGGMTLFAADLTPPNATALHGLFPFTAPVSLRDRRTTIGCGDRLGLATPGHVRAAENFDVAPVLAQQSMRELTLTGRDYPGVVADATFMVFQEGYERGWGADGDHLKTIADIDKALDAGMPMITLDLTDVMSAAPATWDTSRIESEFARMGSAVTRRVLDTWADRRFAVTGASIPFDRIEAERCALMYGRAVDFAAEVDGHLRRRRGDRYDLEISIDETTAPTLPAHHLFIAGELRRRGVTVSSMAPRFIGEFQKGIDYIGDTAELERQLLLHCAIAESSGGYKISIHSGSDKFSVYPAIGRCTGMHVHVKTAGTSWLEAVRVVSRANPALFRDMLGKATAAFGEASKLYHVTTDLSAIPDAGDLPDAELPRYLDERDSRQLLHITYGALLSDPMIRGPFFETLGTFEEEHYISVERLMERHLRLLGTPVRPGTIP